MRTSGENPGSFAATLFHSATGHAVGSWFSSTSAVTALLSFLCVNYRGAGQTGRVEIVFTGFKIAVLLVVVAFGLGAITAKAEPAVSFTPFLPEGVVGLWVAMGLVFIAFEGYEVIVQTAEEVENPKKTIPQAILISICVAIVIYVLIAVVMLGAVTAPPPGRKSTSTWANSANSG